MATLVTFFSAEGTTAKVAKELAAAIGADIFEIRPEKPYTAADIRWTNPLARCNREKFGKKDVPVTGTVPDFAGYDTVLIGFPIWYEENLLKLRLYSFEIEKAFSSMLEQLLPTFDLISECKNIYEEDKNKWRALS